MKMSLILVVRWLVTSTVLDLFKEFGASELADPTFRFRRQHMEMVSVWMGFITADSEGNGPFIWNFSQRCCLGLPFMITLITLAGAQCTGLV